MELLAVGGGPSRDAPLLRGPRFWRPLLLGRGPVPPRLSPLARHGLPRGGACVWRARERGAVRDLRLPVLLPLLGGGGLLPLLGLLLLLGLVRGDQGQILADGPALRLGFLVLPIRKRCEFGFLGSVQLECLGPVREGPGGRGKSGPIASSRHGSRHGSTGRPRRRDRPAGRAQVDLAGLDGGDAVRHASNQMEVGSVAGARQTLPNGPELGQGGVDDGRKCALEEDRIAAVREQVGHGGSDLGDSRDDHGQELGDDIVVRGGGTGEGGGRGDVRICRNRGWCWCTTILGLWRVSNRINFNPVVKIPEWLGVILETGRMLRWIHLRPTSCLPCFGH
mmetsp:Transcript_56775/g.120547  ORF Transcript_56775/g.120547 Transcript_56775/m.120547 type:complete len:336 (+) Transcript_56775:69-1076(+)